jgi:hypothetical protein
MIQLDPFKTMLVMSHSQNTFNKDMFREQGNNEIIRKTQMKIKDFIKDKRIREIFMIDHKSLVPVEGKNIKANSFRQPIQGQSNQLPQIDPKVLEQLDPELRAKILGQIQAQSQSQSALAPNPNPSPSPNQPIRFDPQMIALMDPEMRNQLMNNTLQLNPQMIAQMHPELREKILAQLQPQSASAPAPNPSPSPTLNQIDPKILEQMDPEFRAKILAQLNQPSEQSKQFNFSV